MTAARASAFACCAFLIIPAAGIAQEMTMADVPNLQRLTGDELRQALTGAKVTHKTRHGSTRHWYNNADGKFTASTDSQGYKGAPTAYPTTGAGSWHISPKDQYCVAIEWRRDTENWCVFVFRSGERYYFSARQNDPAARVREIWFRK
ncbi:MAG TPA: hypothetical protein VIA19_06075 [Burkholderiales bacterium]|jgi:hypothetical protein